MLVLGLAVIAGALPGVARAQAFLSVVDDMPLMPGLEEEAETSLLFEKPSGRLAEVTAQGQVRPEAVRSFYAAALPQLGWLPVDTADAGNLVFARDWERLEIRTAATGNRTTVTFSIAPQ